MLKHRLLVIEDDTSLCQNLKILFRRDYEVVIAADGRMGYQHAQVCEPDLIVLDLIMPRMSGIEFCHAIRMVPKMENVPIIVISGLATEEDEEEIKRLGVDVFLRKPFEMNELLDHVRRLLKHIPKSTKDMSIYDIQGYE